MNKIQLFRLLLVSLIVGAVVPGAVAAGTNTDAANVVVEPKLLEGLQYRSLNFSRGGRSTAVAGVVGDPLTYYFGGTGGGVWKTVDGGSSWQNVSDKDFKVGSIGAIAVAASDPNVIYVGTGSACPRGNISPGIGIYRSTDAGSSWTHVGLPEAGQIGRIQVHPTNPDLVYAAVLGHIFGPNEERGVYRSSDGGENWERVLFVSERTGAVDLAMDPSNPRILYAALWTAERKPWTLISGSKEGGIYKSTDSGNSWEKLAGGLPDDLVGKIGLTVSAANPDRLWAIIEANKGGGIYRSDNAGRDWSKVSEEARLRQRPWYYNHVYADPQDENTVYVLNTRMYKSTDGGSTYALIPTPHGDNHDLWINPNDNKTMVEANDGGANVSFTGGSSWSSIMNQPTAEIYRVTVDHQYPYRVYGAQQDNSTVSVPSRQMGRRVVPDWYRVGGCESGHIAVDPRNPDIAYAGCYGGDITRINRKTGESRPILVYPQLQLGQAPRDLKYRFQWNAPIRISPHNPDYLYHTSQVVHRSTNGGQSWSVVSPDLSRNDKQRQDYAGGPISHDSTGIEVYGVIFAFEESPLRAGHLWAGTDDGRVHLSTDNGRNWTEITPSDMPEWGTVNTIELSRHDPGRAFLAVHRYREDDFSPYIFRTNDYGESWQRLTDGSNGIPSNHFVRVVREDPDRQGLLYAGTEFGLYASFDDGAHWQSLQLNLPVTPVTDLAVHRKDLVVATQGRAFWVLDDLSPLHQVSQMENESSHLFASRPALRGGSGALLAYYFEKEPEGEIKLEILDAADKVLASYTGKAGQKAPAPQRRGQEVPHLTAKKGLNRFNWNLRSNRVETPPGVVIWGTAPGATVMPGTYQVRLTAGDWSQTQPLEVGLSPRLSVSEADLKEQWELLAQIRAQIETVYERITTIREVRAQVQSLTQRLKKAGHTDEPLTEEGQSLLKQMQEIEEGLTQTKSKSRQDTLNYPPRLDNQLIMVYAYVARSDNRPTAGAHERFADLQQEIRPFLAKLDSLLAKDLKDFNRLARKKDFGPIILSQH